MRLFPILLPLTLLACGEPHARVDAKDAPTRTKAQALTLDGAQIVWEKGGQYERICSGSGSPTTKGSSPCVNLYFYVFPVVEASSPASNNVPAWVTCSGDEKTAAECEASLRSYRGDLRGSVAVRVGDRDAPLRAVSGWESAIEDATKRHGLVSPRGAPVLRLGRDR